MSKLSTKKICVTTEPNSDLQQKKLELYDTLDTLAVSLKKLF